MKAIGGGTAVRSGTGDRKQRIVDGIPAPEAAIPVIGEGLDEAVERQQADAGSVGYPRGFRVALISAKSC